MSNNLISKTWWSSLWLLMLNSHLSSKFNHPVFFENQENHVISSKRRCLYQLKLWLLKKLVKSQQVYWYVLIWCIFSSFEIEQSLTMAGFTHPSAPVMDTQFSLPTSTVEMSIRCTGLADCDWLSKSDPVAIIFGKLQGQWSSSRHVFTNFFYQILCNFDQ